MYLYPTESVYHIYIYQLNRLLPSTDPTAYRPQDADYPGPTDCLSRYQFPLPPPIRDIGTYRSAPNNYTPSSRPLCAVQTQPCSPLTQLPTKTADYNLFSISTNSHAQRTEHHPDLSFILDYSSCFNFHTPSTPSFTCPTSYL